MKKTTSKKPTKKPAAKKTTRRVAKPRMLSPKEVKVALADLKTVGEIARNVKAKTLSQAATMQEAKIVGLNYDAITTAVAKALKKRDGAIMAEIAKIEGIVRRVEEIVAVVERSEILLTKMDATVHREIVVRAGELNGCEHVGCEKPEPHKHEIGGPCAAEAT